MTRLFLVALAGAALFFGIVWQFKLLDPTGPTSAPVVPTTTINVAQEKDLGKDLYDARPYPPFNEPARRSADPIVLYGTMNPMNLEEVPSQVGGRILFIGEEVDDATVLAAGSAAFLAEPYYIAEVRAGRQKFVKFYRQLQEGETVAYGQMLAMIEPAKALGQVLEKTAKINASIAERNAAQAAEEEGQARLLRAKGLLENKAIAKEEYGERVLTAAKLKYEHIAKQEAVNLTRIEKDQADIELSYHEIRAFLPYKHSKIKTILRQRGFAVKPADPILVVQNLERLLAEALIEEQYFERLKKKTNITATIEPTLLAEPLHELLGHTRDVTSVAVARDMKIVSGSEDKTVCVWTQDATAPLLQMEHDHAVLVVACTPTAAAENLCLAGCQDGSIYLWNLKGSANDLIKKIDQAHGKDTSITSLAFSPDGTLFASGASDGSIKIWTTADGKEHYGFVPENGVAQCHEDAVTSLNFTPQCRLVSAGRDKTLRVWKLKEKGAVPDGKAINFREGNIPNLGVSLDGKWMLFDHGRTLQLKSVETHKLVHTLSTATNATPFETLAIFSPDNSLILTAGAPEGRLQLWRTPDENTRAFEVRQFATKAKNPVTCAAFSPGAGKGGASSFAVSGSGTNVYLWAIPTPVEVNEHRIQRVPLTLKTQNIDTITRNIRIGFEVSNMVTENNPNGRFEAGRPVTIVID